MELPYTVSSMMKKRLDEGRLSPSKHDLRIDLREPLHPREFASLMFKLLPLNSILGVHVHRIFKVDYSYSKIAHTLGWASLPAMTVRNIWDISTHQETLSKLLPPVHITVALAFGGL